MSSQSFTHVKSVRHMQEHEINELRELFWHVPDRNEGSLAISPIQIFVDVLHINEGK